MAEDGAPGTTHHESRTQSRTQSQERQLTAQAEIANACLEAVKSYERKQCTRTKALHLITTQLLRDDFVASEESRQSTLASYVSMLDELDKERPDPLGAPQQPGNAGGAAGSREHPGGDREDEGERPGADEFRTPEPGRPSLGTRTRSPTPTRDEPAPKKGRVDRTQYAWATAEPVILATLHPDLQQTIKRLRYYTADVKAAKWDLLSTPGAPEFPSSEWTRILSGEAVDLDRVLTAHFSSRRDEKHIETIGDMELSFKSNLPQKHVTTAGDWNLTWNQTVRATAFAFPHRYGELVAYGDYITRLFGALAEPVHTRVIEFDNAVRKRVGARHDLLLTDYAQFEDLKTMHIQSSGANVYGQEIRLSGIAGLSKRKKEACRRWNAGVCPSTASNCRYRHVCSRCGAGGHTEPRCSKSAV